MEKNLKVQLNDVPEKFSNNYDKALFYLINDMTNEDVDAIERLVQKNITRRSRDNIIIPPLLITEILSKNYVPYREGESKNLKKLLEI